MAAQRREPQLLAAGRQVGGDDPGEAVAGRAGTAGETRSTTASSPSSAAARRTACEPSSFVRPYTEAGRSGQSSPIDVPGGAGPYS